MHKMEEIEISTEGNVVETEVEGSIQMININETEVKNGKRCGRKKSVLWNHFEKLQGGTKARCNHCNYVLSTSAGNISNLLRHLRKKHPAVAANIKCYPAVKTLVMEPQPIIVEVERSYCADDNQIRIVRTQEQKPLQAPKQMRREDMETLLKRDHPYVEISPYEPEQVFGQFLQAELNKFNSELLRRQCKREILQVLMKYQSREDEIYISMSDSPNLHL